MSRGDGDSGGRRCRERAGGGPGQSSYARSSATVPPAENFDLRPHTHPLIDFLKRSFLQVAARAKLGRTPPISSLWLPSEIWR